MQFPAPSPQPTRARNVALSVALLIVIGAFLWLLVSNTLLEAWTSLSNDHATWHILGDVLFGLLVAVLAFRLVRQSVIRLETTEQVMARYARGMTALYETSLEINAQPDTVTLLNIILQRTCNLLGTNMGSVYLCSEHDDTIVLVASQPRQDVGTVLRLGEGLAGRVAQTGEPFTVYDYSHWPERAARFDDSHFGRMLAVPLKLHEKIIGVLTIDDAQPGDFSEDDLRLAKMFADQVVLALQNRQLLEQVQTDLLQRRQVEEALRDSEERYRLLIENQGEGICYVDENEYLIFANPAANELFGLPPHGLEGRNLREFMDEAEFAVIQQQTAIRRAGQTSTYENRVTRADGQVRILLVTARPRYAQDGQFMGTFSIFRDITERKQAEEELGRMRQVLERRNQQLTQILEAGNALRVTLDVDTVLREIVYSAQRALDYGIVVLNILDPLSRKFRVHSFAGLDETGRQALEHVEYDVDQELRLMRPEFALGRAYFIPTGSLNWEEEMAGPTYVPPAPSAVEPDAWDPDDALFIPLEQRSGEIVGTIWLDAPLDGKRPTIDSLRPLEIFVNQAVIAVEHARLFEAERQRRHEMETIYQASLELTTSLELNEILPALLRGALQLVPAEYVCVFLSDSGQLFFGAAMDNTGRQLSQPQRKPRPDGMLATVARTGEMLIVEDDRQPQSPFRLPSGQPDIARIAIPLRVEAMVIGVMGIDYPGPRHIDEAEQRILGLLVAQAAITLQNAQLHEEVKRYAFELEQRVVERTAELERQRQRLQTILDSAGEGIQIVDTDGRIEYINPATEQLTGFTAQEVVGQVSRLWDFISGESSGLDQARQQLWQGQAWRGEIVHQRRDGARYDSSVTVTPLLDQRQRITGYVAVHRDITHLKELERLKGQFVQRIGHELRMPLAIIKLYVELLGRGKLDKLDEYVQIMLAQIERQQRLLDSFLEISQFDAGLVPVHHSQVNLNQVVNELLLNHRPQSAQRGLTLVEELDAELDRRLLTTDRTLVARALTYLLDNALRYTPQAGRITITTTTAENAERRWLTVAIHNSGPGISPEEMAHLFERFYRGDAARDYKNPGAGLGLAITKTIAELLNGRLTVHSDPGQGVTFTLWLADT